MIQNTKWFCTIAGSGVMFGIFSYFQSSKKAVYNSWSTDFVPSAKWDYNWDKRDASSLIHPKKGSNQTDENKEKQLKEVTPTATRHLFFVWHGQYNRNVKPDSLRGLTKLGREQANLTGLRLKNLGYPFTRFIHSTMTRAKETASIIHKHIPDVPIESCDLLREGTPTPAEPPLSNFKTETRQFYEDGARIEAAFRKYIHRADARQKKDSFELFVCHANVIRYFVCRAMQFPPEAWQRFFLYHGSITWITIWPSGRVYLHYVGDSGHIPPEMLTTTHTSHLDYIT